MGNILTHDQEFHEVVVDDKGDAVFKPISPSNEIESSLIKQVIRKRFLIKELNAHFANTNAKGPYFNHILGTTSYIYYPQERLFGSYHRQFRTFRTRTNYFMTLFEFPEDEDIFDLILSN